MSVSQTRDGGIAIVTVDNPPVNALGAAVRQGLWDAFEASEADPEVDAVVLICAGRTFIAGADVKEFGQPPVEPLLPGLLERIEGASKPWVAAIHGTALGGGLETALACSHRIALPGARLGLPEVTLGIIPGAGGTVRLPRLIPADRALEMIAGGRPVAAEAALEMGLVDAVAEGDLQEPAVALARHALEEEPRTPMSRRGPALFDPAAFETVAARIGAKAGGAEAPKAAIAQTRAVLTLPAEAALARERETFLALRDGPQSKALRHIFFAERATARIDELVGVAPRDLSHIGVVGGGTMGAGIAAACLLSGYPVTMVERDAAAAQAGRARVETILEGSRKRGVIDEARRRALLEGFATSGSYDALAPADLVIEAVFEDMDVKRAVIARLDAATRPEAILASNTSYLDVGALAAATEDPSRVLGLHFFAPAHVMKLLEVVAPDGVAASALATAFAFAKRLGKIPVRAGVCEGFIANRIMSAYRFEAEIMLEDGALPWEIDRAMRGFGLPMGLFEMQDLSGLEISWAMRKRQAATRDPAVRYVDIGDRLCEAGRFGRKAGKGYYNYETGEAEPDPEVEALILAEAAAKGIARHPIGETEILERILSTMQTEGARILEAGIARSADDIDVVMVNAYGFPRWRGGPMYMARVEG